MTTQGHSSPSDERSPEPGPLQAPLPLLLFVLCGAPFMASLDLFVVNVAFPAIGEDFPGSSLSGLSWVLNAYVIVYAALLIPLGRWADTIGTRRVFLLGLLLFTLGSLAAAASTSLPLLVTARATQAIGAAALTPTSLGLLLRVVPADRQARAVRLWVTSSAIGSAVGPLVGGLLVELSWRWVFLINLPVGIALIALSVTKLPAKDVTQAGRVNLIGAALATVGAGALCLALVQGGEWGWFSTPTLTSIAVSLSAALGLVIDSRRSREPLIPASVMRVRSFAWANATMVLFSATFAAGLLGLSLWLQEVWHYSALQTGLAIAPGPLMVPIVALGSGPLVARITPGKRAAAGSLLWAAGAVLMLLTAGETPNYLVAILPGWLLAGIGVGLTLPTVLSSATLGLPAQYASAGSAVINVTRQLGTVIGISTLIALITPDALPTRSTFVVAWWTIAAIGVLAALTALRMPQPAADATPRRHDS